MKDINQLTTFRIFEHEADDQKEGIIINEPLSLEIAIKHLILKMIKDETLFYRKIENSDGFTSYEFVYSANDLSQVKKKNPKLF